MRFIEFTLIILSINFSIALFAQLDILPTVRGNYTIESTDSYDAYGKVIESNTSLAYRMEKWISDNISYIRPGVQDTNQQYLQSGGDFVRAWKIFWDIFLGTFVLYPTLINFGVPSNITWFFVVPLYFLYVIAVVEFFSGRKIQPEG